MSERSYLNLMQTILDSGHRKKNRTGIDTLSIFGSTLQFDLDKFPLLTTKKMYWKGIVEELLWFIRGDTDSKLLEDKNVNIWKGNTSREFLDRQGLDSYPEGYIGPGYGYQWRSFSGTYYGTSTFNVDDGELNYYMTIKKDGIDQLQQAIDLINTDPSSRRILVSAWNPSQNKQMALPPCHIMYQFDITDDKLNCQFYMRSVDVFLGLPFNIASYALLTNLIAKITGYTPGKLIFVGGDTHIYENHIEQAKLQISRTEYEFPNLVINKDIQVLSDIEGLVFEDLLIDNYLSHPAIKADMAV